MKRRIKVLYPAKATSIRYVDYSDAAWMLTFIEPDGSLCLQVSDDNDALIFELSDIFDEGVSTAYAVRITEESGEYFADFMSPEACRITPETYPTFTPPLAKETSEVSSS